jgi:hypothetical protein
MKTVRLAVAVCLLLLPVAAARAAAQTLVLEDYNDQDVFNNFSGNRGELEVSGGTVTTSFSTACRAGGGACLQVAYSLPSGFAGIWNSAIGHVDYDDLTLDFTDLYRGLLNSSGNPTNVAAVAVSALTFRAKGGGGASFNHTVKVELKDSASALAAKYFVVPNAGDWTVYTFAINEMSGIDLTRMKEFVFVIESQFNEDTGTILLDDLELVTNEAAYDPASFSDDQLLDAISHRSFAYFLRFTDRMGFVHDRSSSSDLISVGAIGYQLAAYCVGARRGWAAGLESRVEAILSKLMQLAMATTEPSSGSTAHAGYRGFFYHFLDANQTSDPQNSKRKNTGTELSLYDTMLLIYGALTAKQCFPSNAGIASNAQQLFERVEWNWMVDTAAGPNQYRFRLGWTPESGFLSHVDGYTDEAMLVDVLALGSPTHPVTLDTYKARARYLSSDGIATAFTGSLFNYTFAAGWLDYERMGVDEHAQPLDIWTNNRLAIQASRQFSIDHADTTPADDDDDFTTYGPSSWGLTAADNLADRASALLSAYYAFGALPTEQNIRFGTDAPHLGTLAVYGAGSAIPLTPAESIAALRHFLTIPGLWVPLFGFGDAFSTDPHYFVADSNGNPVFDSNGNLQVYPATWLTLPWVNRVQMGVDEGPMLVAIENHRTGLIRGLTRQDPSIRRGLVALMGGYTDPVLTPAVGAVRAVHFTELRDRIEALRKTYSLPPFAWSGTPASGVTIQAEHLDDLRGALDEVYVAAGISPPQYTDPNPAGVPIKAVHITELRSFVFRLE